MGSDELSMKLLVDTKTDKLCFAEAGRDVVDFLSGLLSLPLGTVANLLTTERMVGSIGDVLGSMEKLDANYKSKLLRPSPASTALSRLEQLLGSDLSRRNLFTCEGPNTSSARASSGYNKTDPRASCGYLSATRGMTCRICKNRMIKLMTMAPDASANGPKVVAVAPKMYIVKDHLSVTPATNVMSGITLLAECGIKDISSLQEKTVKIGKEEALKILVASLKSKTVLTDVFLQKKNARCKREPPEEEI